MSEIIPKTVGESLYLSMASLGMAFASERHGKRTYQQSDYIVRNKNYYGYLKGSIQLGSFLNDEKWKMGTSDACCYCGSRVDLTLDHLIPQVRDGKHSADNLVVACRSCNSSKNKLDFLEWMAKKGIFPSIGLLRRYLKLAIHYCMENELMDILLEPKQVPRPKQPSLFDDLEMDNHPEQCAAVRLALPFKIELIPHKFPEPADLVWWFEPITPEVSDLVKEQEAKLVDHMFGCLKRGRTDIEIKKSLNDAGLRRPPGYTFKGLKDLALQKLAAVEKKDGNESPSVEE